MAGRDRAAPRQGASWSEDERGRQPAEIAGPPGVVAGTPELFDDRRVGPVASEGSGAEEEERPSLKRPAAPPARVRR